MAKLIVESKGSDDRPHHVRCSRVARGAYSIVLCTRERALRLPRSVGRAAALPRHALGDGGYVVASESCALGTIGAQYLREIGSRRDRPHRCRRAGIVASSRSSKPQPALCMFEYIYFARPDSQARTSARSTWRATRWAGELAREHPVEADVVMAVPDSAVAGGIGYATESGSAVRRRADQEPLYRAHVHQPRSAHALARRASQVQSRRREPARPARRSSSTTRSCAARRRRASSRCCAKPVRAKCTCASPRRRSSIRAISASTWRPTTSSSRRTTPSRRFARRPARIRWATSAWTA